LAAEWSAIDGYALPEGMYVETCGEGDPIFLIAGNGGNTSFWHHISAGLAQDYQLIAFDYRSAPPRNEKGGLFETAIRKADDLKPLLDVLGIDQAVILGHSTGAQAAALFCAVSPERVKKLIFSGGFISAGPYVTTSMILRRDILNRLGPQEFLLDGLFRAVPPAQLFRQLETEGPDGLLSFRAMPDPDIETERINAICDGDITTLAPTIKVPTSVLHARDDSVFPFQLGEIAAQTLPNAQLIPIEKGGHLAPMMAPKAYGDALLQGLKA